MSDLNHYLRRADVEALLDGKIEHLDEIAGLSVGRATGNDLVKIQHGIAIARAKVDALRTVKAQLGLCQQFSYRSFHEYDGPGTEYHALVDKAADRVPLIPVKIEAIAAS